MRGWAIDLDVTRPMEEGCCIGVVASSEYPETGLMTEVLAKGLEKYPEATWVVRDKDRLVLWACQQVGIDPIKVPLNPAYKHPDAWREGRTVDNRRTARDFEFLFGCEQIVVFKSAASSTLDSLIEWGSRPGVPASLHIVERGKKKRAPTRRGRKIE